MVPRRLVSLKVKLIALFAISYMSFVIYFILVIQKDSINPKHKLLDSENRHPAMTVKKPFNSENQIGKAKTYKKKAAMKKLKKEKPVVDKFNAEKAVFNEKKAINLSNLDQEIRNQEDPKLIVKGTIPFNYQAVMEELNKEKVSPEDPRLIRLIRGYYLELPSSFPYNLTNPEKLDDSEGQVPVVDRILKYQEGGFFIECGAYNGEKRSNTLMLEKQRHWSGLLIEADPSNYAELKLKHRNSYTVHACLNTKPYPAKMTFNQYDQMGRLLHDDQEVRAWMRGHLVETHETQVQCFPFYSLLLAMNRTNIDYFSLDIEGDELYVLQTIPFEKVDIKLMSVEYIHSRGGKRKIKDFLMQKGYEAIAEVAYDIIFKKTRHSG